MQPPGDAHQFYVIMAQEDPEDKSWEALDLVSEGTFVWTKDVPFRLVLFFLAQSAGGLSESGPEQGSHEKI
jgi:hypothetical protein